MVGIHPAGEAADRASTGVTKRSSIVTAAKMPNKMNRPEHRNVMFFLVTIIPGRTKDRLN
jgi:hypothetical protein